MVGTEERRLPGDVVGNVIGRVTMACVRNAKAVVIITLLATIALGAGMKNTQIDQELSDGLPESENKLALDRVMDKLPGISTLEAVLLELDPNKTDIGDIREQDAIRAEEEVWQYLVRHVDQHMADMGEEGGLTGGVGLNHIVKQVNVVVNEDGARQRGEDPDDYYVLPPNDEQGRQQFDTYWGIANNTVQSNIELTIRNPDYQSTLLAIQYNVEELDSDQTKAIGLALTRATEDLRRDLENQDYSEYPEWADIFKHEHIFNIGPQSGLAKFEGHLIEELPVFVPAAFILILMMLFIGLRNPGTAMIGMITLGIATVATVGLLGWLRIPFTSANIAMVPLIVGNGIDYAIHVLNEYSEERSKGLSLEDTFKAVGNRAGVAMVLATVTSVSGILSMLFATSISLRQLAISASFAIIIVTLLALMFLPAAVALFGDKMHVKFKPSSLMPKIYRVVNKYKVVSLVVFLGLSGVFWANTTNLSYFTDVTASNFPEDDGFTQTYLHLKERQGGSADELVIIEGDLTDPATLAYIRALEEDLMTQQPFVHSRAHVNSLTVLLGAYHVLADSESGGAALVQSGGQGVLEDYAENPEQIGEDAQQSQEEQRPVITPYEGRDHVRDAAPTDRETIERYIAEMQASAAWQPLVDFLYAQDGSVTIIDVLVDDQGNRDLETLEAIQRMMEDVVARHESERPDDVQVYINGLTTGLYQYLDYSFEWLQKLFIISAVVGTTLMFLFTRSLRATGAFLVPMLFTTTWFLGLLPFFGIQVGAGLILPMIFITSIGSDYAAHMSWNILKSGSPEETYKTTGKAIAYSAMTDFGAFFVFSFSYLNGVRDQALATSLAIAAIFVVTMLVVPLFFNKEVGEIKGAKLFEKGKDPTPATA